VPEGEDAEDYVDRVVEEQLPAVEDQGIAEFCDVFCEEGAFRRPVPAGAGGRSGARTDTEGPRRGTRSHRRHLAGGRGRSGQRRPLCSTRQREDVAALRDAGVTPVLLPGTAFGLGAEYADARAFLDAGAPVAIATDFNPNCHLRAWPSPSRWPAWRWGMTPAEALVGATATGAQSIDRNGLGTLAEGEPADLAIIDAPSHVHVPYSYGVNRVQSVLEARRARRFRR